MVHTIQFRKVRDAQLAEVAVATNRVVIRLEKVCGCGLIVVGA